MASNNFSTFLATLKYVSPELFVADDRESAPKEASQKIRAEPWADRVESAEKGIIALLQGRKLSPSDIKAELALENPLLGDALEQLSRKKLIDEANGLISLTDFTSQALRIFKVA